MHRQPPESWGSPRAGPPSARSCEPWVWRVISGVCTQFLPVTGDRDGCLLTVPRRCTASEKGRCLRRNRNRVTPAKTTGCFSERCRGGGRGVGGAEEGRTAPHGRLGTGPGAGGETHLRFNYVEIYATPQSSCARRLSGHSSETWSAFTVLCGPHPARPHTRGALRTRDKTREQNIPPSPQTS